MDMHLDIDTLSAVFSYFKHLVYINHTALTEIELSESLSTVSHNNLQRAKLCDFQINRMCNMIKYLADDVSDPNEDWAETFGIKQLIEEILSTFSSTVSGYIDLSTTYKENSHEHSSITVNKTRFELFFLNIFYCCLKDTPIAEKNRLKISVTVSETADSIVFRIKNNAPTLSSQVVDAGLSSALPIAETFSKISGENLIPLSLRVAKKSVMHLGGRISYVPLKSGNRFDIFLPKASSAEIKFRQAVPYTPNQNLYNEVLADIKLEQILKDVIEAFGDLGDITP